MFELYADLFADALRLHRDAVEHVRDAHRALGVRDDDKLRIGLELLHDQVETLVVGLVQGGVHFVEEAERRGLAAEDRKQQS